MAVRDYQTLAENFSANAREIDFVTRFGIRFQSLLDILGVSDVVRKQPGARQRYYDATVVLNANTVSEGDETPLSEATLVEKFLPEMELEPFNKSVTAKAIKDYGYDIAVAKTDEAFLNELQKKVMNKFYSFVKTGSRTNIQTSFQLALAYAKGIVDNEFKVMNRDSSGTVAFINVLDFAAYLGGASITVQNAYGMQYVKDFMGYNTIFLCSANEIPKNKVIATAIENIIAYYIDPSDEAFARAGLEYTVDGVTNFVGFHTAGNYNRTASDCYALMGLSVSAEYLNGIAVVTVEASGSSTSLTLTSVAATTEGTKLTLTMTPIKDDMKLFYKSASSITAPDYKAELDSDWTAIAFPETGIIDNLVVSGSKIMVVAVNGTGQTVAASSAVTVTNKS